MTQDPNTNNLHAELKSLADTLEEILNSSSDNDQLEKLRTKAESIVKDTRLRLSQTSDKLAQQTKQIASQTDDYVRTNPWASVGIGAAVGVVLGILLSRR